jgi:hypothetical protein
MRGTVPAGIATDLAAQIAYLLPIPARNGDVTQLAHFSLSD